MRFTCRTHPLVSGEHHDHLPLLPGLLGCGRLRTPGGLLAACLDACLVWASGGRAARGPHAVAAGCSSAAGRPAGYVHNQRWWLGRRSAAGPGGPNAAGGTGVSGRRRCLP
jgi:hypothetical protein